MFTVALYAQRRWYKQRRIPQKSASTEATHEIHYIPSVLLGPQGRESFRNSRLQAHNSVIGMPIRETPILDDYDYEEEENPLRPEHGCGEDEFGGSVTRPLDSLGRNEEKPDYEKKGLFHSVFFARNSQFWDVLKGHYEVRNEQGASLPEPCGAFSLPSPYSSFF